MRNPTALNQFMSLGVGAWPWAPMFVTVCDSGKWIHGLRVRKINTKKKRNKKNFEKSSRFQCLSVWKDDVVKRLGKSCSGHSPM